MRPVDKMIEDVADNLGDDDCETVHDLAGRAEDYLNDPRPYRDR